MFENAALAPAPIRARVIESTWSALVTSGPTLFSAERQAVIADARAAWAGALEPNPADGVLGEVAHWLAVDAGGITAAIVDDFEARGLDRHRYLETVGVVGRLANVDFYARGLGAEPPALPGPDDSPPTGEVERSARITDGWVPALGPLSAPHVLDALPGEGRSLRALHEPMYVKMTEIGNGHYADDLDKMQIEFLAARASYLNECFYWLLAHTSFLRASSETQGIDLDITAVAGRITPEVRGGASLVALVDALTTEVHAEPVAERNAVVAELGGAATERAMGVIATFQMMNRLLDGVGAPVHPSLLELGLELGFRRDDLPI